MISHVHAATFWTISRDSSGVYAKPGLANLPPIYAVVARRVMIGIINDSNIVAQFSVARDVYFRS
jgi:hypothetical protein